MPAGTSRVTLRTLRLMWPFAIVALVQALLTGLSLDIMSTVRAYVAGEGLWTSAIRDIASAERFIRGFQGLGCRFSLDDFGSGMSSF
jgi:predicted signal transduction protein with EAL and GGDEF domain